MIKSTNPQELNQWLQSGAAVLVDVREPDEYKAGHIKGATLIPLATVAADTMPPDAVGKKLVMQCRSGGRSRTACGILAKEMPGAEVYNLEGGIIEWAAAGLGVEV